jgi:hypothetical protein
MLQEFRKEGLDSWMPQGKVGEGVSICFLCEDALAIYRQVISRGIQASRPSSGTGCGSRLCQTQTATGSSSRATRKSRRRRCTQGR